MKRIVFGMVLVTILTLSFSGVKAQICFASFDFDTNGLDVDFTNQSTGVYNAVFWDFGDGFGFSGDIDPTYTYLASGTYEVCLSIFDTLTGLCYDDTCIDVTVSTGGGGGGGSDCNAAFSYDTELLTVFCENNSTGSFLTATYDYGDGSLPTFDEEYTYEEPGTYEVCLTIFNIFPFCTSTRCKDVTVFELDCEPAFSYSFNPETNLYKFNNETEVGEYDELKWYFGDGNTSGFDNPSYTYNEPGIYEVCLETYDGGELCGITCEEVSVFPLSIKQLEDAHMGIFPNPSTGQIFLSGFDLNEEIQLSVFSMTGQLMGELNVHNSDQGIELNLAPGSYVVQCRTQEVTKTLQLSIVEP